MGLAKPPASPPKPPFGAMVALSVSVSTVRQLPIVFIVTTYAMRPACLLMMAAAWSKWGPSKYGASLIPRGSPDEAKPLCARTSSRTAAICSKSRATVGLPGILGQAKFSSTAWILPAEQRRGRGW
eukprot:scaffold9439_cov118-Isochrysis_galbana.AAC.3